MKYLEQEIDAFFKYGEKYNMTRSQTQSEEESNGKHIIINGKKVINFTRQDYLALGSEPKIKNFMLQDINKNDISSSASQVILKPDSIEKLELALAKLHHLNHSVLSTSGYAANINAMQALGTRLKCPHISAYSRATGIGKATQDIPTVFIIHRDSHYSLIHGVKIACKLSNTCVSYMYDGRDPRSIEARLNQVQQRYGNKAVKVIVSDTLVSSTGHLTDVKYLYNLALQHDCLLYLDEAYAVGAIGHTGAGVFIDQMGTNFDKNRVIIIGTLTKAFSQAGGYVSFGSKRLAFMVKALSPQYVFSAPTPQWMAITIRKTLTLLQQDWGIKRRALLHETSAYLRTLLNNNGYNTLQSASHIVPVLIGDEVECLSIGNKLVDYGYNVACFRFPAVAKEKAILRISVCADITKQEIEGLVNAIVTCHKLEAIPG